MLGLCLYVPVSNSDPIEVEYFESNGLPSELKSLFNKLSVFVSSQEFSTYQRWRKVRKSRWVLTFYCYICQTVYFLKSHYFTVTVTKSFFPCDRKN